MNTYKKINNLDRKIKKINNNIELKHTDAYFNEVVSNDGSDLLLLNGMGEGLTVADRIGGQVTATSIQLRGQITTSEDNLSSTRVRVIAFWDKQANGAIPITGVGTTAGGELLDATIVDDPTLSPFNYKANDRYRVIYDKIFTLNPHVVLETNEDITTKVVPVSLQFKKKIKLGRVTKYDEGVTGIASILTNSLFLVFYSQEGDDPSVQVGTRLYFKDA